MILRQWIYDPKTILYTYIHSFFYHLYPHTYIAFAFMVAPGAAYQHFISNYQYYLLQKSGKDPIHFYLHGFERVIDTVDDYYGSSKGLDDDTKPPLTDIDSQRGDQNDKAYKYVMDYWKLLHDSS